MCQSLPDAIMLREAPLSFPLGRPLGINRANSNGSLNTSQTASPSPHMTELAEELLLFNPSPGHPQVQIGHKGQHNQWTLGSQLSTGPWPTTGPAAHFYRSWGHSLPVVSAIKSSQWQQLLSKVVSLWVKTLGFEHLTDTQNINHDHHISLHILKPQHEGSPTHFLSSL